MLKNIKKIIVTGFVAVSALVSSVAFAETTPYELTQKAANQLFADLKTHETKIKSDPNYLKTIVHQNLMPYVHVNYAGSVVLGKHYESTTPEQRERFFAAFGKFIEQTYAQSLTMYKGQEIQIQPQKLTGKNTATVNVRLVQQQPINITFWWRKNSKTGEWQVYNMVAENINMLNTKQQEWAGILRQKGIDYLTSQLNQSATQPIILNK